MVLLSGAGMEKTAELELMPGLAEHARGRADESTWPRGVTAGCGEDRGLPVEPRGVTVELREVSVEFAGVTVGQGGDAEGVTVELREVSVEFAGVTVGQGGDGGFSMDKRGTSAGRTMGAGMNTDIT